MLKSIWTWWRTPMVPKSLFDELMIEHAGKLDENERLSQRSGWIEDENAQLQVDVNEANAERDAAQLERDKAIGKFEYVEKRNKELESMLADRNSYIRLLEDQLRSYQKDEMDDFEDDCFDDYSDIDDLCDECGMEMPDCDCDDDGYCDDCGELKYNCDCEVDK